MMGLRNAVSFDLEFRLLDAWGWNSRSKTRVWAGPVVVSRPPFQNPSNMVFIERNHDGGRDLSSPLEFILSDFSCECVAVNVK